LAWRVDTLSAKQNVSTGGGAAAALPAWGAAEGAAGRERWWDVWW
jgi:hypothetical protein